MRITLYELKQIIRQEVKRARRLNEMIDHDSQDYWNTRDGYGSSNSGGSNYADIIGSNLSHGRTTAKNKSIDELEKMIKEKEESIPHLRPGMDKEAQRAILQGYIQVYHDKIKVP